MAYQNNVNFIREHVSEEDRIDQLMEELSELMVACSKRKRAVRGSNPTPVSAQDALLHIKEESQDVLNVLCAMGMFGFEDPEENATEHMKWKMRRWVERVKSGAAE